MDRADEILASGNPAAILKMVFDSRAAVDEGRYCECEQPSLIADELMCGHCLLRNRGQEVKRVHRSVDAHEFVPGKLRGLMCKVCTQTADAPRHHGTPAVGRTSWGTDVQGV